MRDLIRTTACCLLVPVLVAASIHASPSHGGEGARLEGRVLAIDGRPASGYRVHLIGSDGNDVGQSVVDGGGQYSFPGLGAGEYSLGVESPAGELAPVASPPIRLEERELARRDIKLLEAGPANVNQALEANPSLGAWWGERTTAAKIWTIVGVVAVAGVTATALDDEDDSSPN